MKNRKNTIIIIESIIIIILAIALVVIFIQNEKKEDGSSGTNEQTITFKEVSKDVPDFSIQLTGGYEGYITKEYVQEKNVKLYEFDATVNNGWNRNTDTYIGYKLNDLLNAFDVTNYSSIEFRSNDGVKIIFGRYLLSENVFIVFYKNGELVDDLTPVMMLNTDYRSNYSVARLISMDMGIGAKKESEAGDNQTTDDKSNDDVKQ